jgi:anti-sigma factor RsiW
MTEHECVRGLLALAASGDLSPEETRRVQQHLPGCEECRRTIEDFTSLSNVLRALPTPQPGPQLLARVHQAAEIRMDRNHRGWNEIRLMAPLVAAGWLVAFLTWPVTKWAAYWLVYWWRIPGDGVAEALATYSIAGFLLASTAVIAAGMRARANGRTR